MPGLREDAPHRSARSRGSLPSLSEPFERDEAIRHLQDDFYSASTRRSLSWKWKTVVSALDRWGHQPFPPTQPKVIALGAALKAGGYATAEAYLLLYRTTSERHGYSFSPSLARTLTDVIRSCTRGRGGPVKPLALPLLRLHEPGLDEDGPWNPDGPVGPVCALVAGAWFLTREVELSCARAALIEFDRDHLELPLVRWRLPASKNDQEALGVARAHGCNCDGSLGSCPWHALRLQVDRLRRLFPERFVGEQPAMDLPLFPKSNGQVVDKEAMTETIRIGASRLGVPLEASDGSARVSGHSLRVSGAQGLARAGVDTWAIQLLGRWGSATVLEYVQAVPLELSSAWARAAARRKSLDEVLSDRRGAPPLHAEHDPPAAAPRELPQALVVEELASLPEVVTDIFVLSDGGIWHRVPASGRSGPSAAWSTVCGWKYASKESRSSERLPDTLVFKQLCARCLPDRRAALKENA